MKTLDPVEPHTWLQPLSRFLGERLGLNFPPDHWKELQRNFLKACDAFGQHDPSDCVEWLLQPDLPVSELHRLAGFLTIGETYFFREKNYFEPMARYLFNEVIERKRKSGQKQLRIWSAACSTGEEPYSIAILLDAMLPDIHDWSIRILATDINPEFIERAQRAVYRPWSFRGTPEWVKQRYFQIEGENHELRLDIRKRVTFDFLNLADDIYPSLTTQTQAMDVIFCRNVLIYFSQEQARKVIGRMENALTQNGWLVLSPTETVYVSGPVLQRQYIHDAILFQKTAKASTTYRPINTAPVLFPQRIARTPLTPRPHISAHLPQISPHPKAPPAKPATPPPAPLPEKLPQFPEENILDRAETLYKNGRHTETIALIQKHLNGHPPKGKEAFLLARAQANTGQLDEALQNALNATETDKLAAEHHYLLAMIQLEKDSPNEAERSLQRVLYLDDRHVMAFFSMGHLSLLQQKPAAAKRYFNEALRLLEKLDPEASVPEGESITARRLKELILSAIEK